MKKWAVLTAVLLVSLGVVWAFARQPRAEAQNAITEVSIEHTGCYGDCPVYTLILRRDGTATFVGTRHVERIGTYTASFGGFDQLTRAIEGHGFSHLKPQYSSRATDLPHTITTVVQGKKQETVDDYGNTGPQQLWEIQTLIDGTVAEAHWKKISSSTNYP